MRCPWRLVLHPPLRPIRGRRSRWPRRGRRHLLPLQRPPSRRWRRPGNPAAQPRRCPISAAHLSVWSPRSPRHWAPTRTVLPHRTVPRPRKPPSETTRVPRTISLRRERSLLLPVRRPARLRKVLRHSHCPSTRRQSRLRRGRWPRSVLPIRCRRRRRPPPLLRPSRRPHRHRRPQWSHHRRRPRTPRRPARSPPTSSRRSGSDHQSSSCCSRSTKLTYSAPSAVTGVASNVVTPASRNAAMRSLT